MRFLFIILLGVNVLQASAFAEEDKGIMTYVLSSDCVVNSFVQKNQLNDGYNVGITLNKEEGEKLYTFTQQLVGKLFQIKTPDGSHSRAANVWEPLKTSFIMTNEELDSAIQLHESLYSSTGECGPE